MNKTRNLNCLSIERPQGIGVTDELIANTYNALVSLRSVAKTIKGVPYELMYDIKLLPKQHSLDVIEPLVASRETNIDTYYGEEGTVCGQAFRNALSIAKMRRRERPIYTRVVDAGSFTFDDVLKGVASVIPSWGLEAIAYFCTHLKARGARRSTKKEPVSGAFGFINILEAH